MPIEFDCTQCGQRLRTPDDTAGKQARCPGCGTLVPIPSQSEPMVGSETSEGSSPTASQSPPNQFADPPPVNPYQSSAEAVSHVALSPGEARSRLLGPAIGLIVAGLMTVVPIVQLTVNSIITFEVTVDQVQAELPDDAETQAMATFVVAATLIVMLTVLCTATALVIGGAIAMLRVRWYWLAKAGTILSFCPCYCCFPIGLPFGIWGLMVLNDVNIRAAFQSNRT